MCTEFFENTDPYNLTFPGWAVIKLEKQSWSDDNIQKQQEWKRRELVEDGGLMDNLTILILLIILRLG